MTLIRNRYLLSSERNTIVLIVQRAIRALPEPSAYPAIRSSSMRTNDPPLYDNSLTGILARLTHGILQDANERAQKDSGASSSAFPNAVSRPRGWLDRLDTWFWKQEMKSREAFLAQSTDIFDLEQRMRRLERARD
jgi:hypothetical protein